MRKSYPIQIRFADIDVMGHVNNANYLHYFEYARLRFFGELLGTEWDWKSKGILLAKNIVEYKQPVVITDQIKVEIFCSKIGEKSYTFSYRIVDDVKCFAEGESIVVCYDYTINSSILIPDKMLAVLSEYSG